MARPKKRKLYCIVLYLLPVLNPESYDGARVLEASGRPMLVIGRSYWIVPIQDEDVNMEGGMKLTEETMEKTSEVAEIGRSSSVETAAGVTVTIGEVTGLLGTEDEITEGEITGAEGEITGTEITGGVTGITGLGAAAGTNLIVYLSGT